MILLRLPTVVNSTDGKFTKLFFSATPLLRWWLLGPDFFFSSGAEWSGWEAAGQGLFSWVWTDGDFWGEGELFLDDFFLMVIGDWNCHYRYYGGRKMWSWSCIRRCSSSSVFFPQNRTVKLFKYISLYKSL